MQYANKLTADTLQRLCALFHRLARRLPLHRLRPDERRDAGAQLFARDPEFVDGVAYALELQPGLFPDARVSAEQLFQALRVADGMGYLSRLLGGLAQQCGETELYIRAWAIKECKQVTSDVIDANNHAHLCPHLDHPRRLTLVLPAVRAMYDDRLKRYQKGARKTAAPLAAPSEEQRRIARRKQERKVVVRAKLGDLLASLRPRRGGAEGR